MQLWNCTIKLSGRCDGLAVFPLWDGAREAAKLCSVCPVEFAEGAGEAEQCQQAQAVCISVLLGKKHSKTDFLAPQCPVSSSALTGFSPVLTTNLVVLFMCQRSVSLTQWWILCWMSVIWLLRANNAEVVGLILVWAIHLWVGLDDSCGSLPVQNTLCLHGFRSLC